jgi:cyclase
VMPVQGNVHLLVGGGVNSAVHVGEEGVMIVDAQPGALSEKVLAAIRGISGKPIRHVVNTSADADHIGGNEALAKAGSTRTGGVVVGQIGTGITATANIIAHENMLNRVSAPTGATAAIAQAAWPTETFFGEKKDMLFNGEGIQFLHQPAAHTDGDMMVYFRRSDVLVTGDVFSTVGYPAIDAARGGSIQGTIDALNRIIDIAIPSNTQEGGTMIVPGHGRVCDEMDVVEYRDMVTIVRDRVKEMADRKMTLAQVQAAKPTFDFDARYGDGTAFVAAVYAGVTK